MLILRFQRTVVKHVVPHAGQWATPTYWRRRKPQEITIHQKIDTLTPPALSRSLVRFHGYRLSMAAQRYRTYTRYYPYGGLDDVLSRFFGTGFPHRIPEDFIVHVALSLITACKVLRRGHLVALQEGWRPITHCDIALRNIFVTRGAAGQWPRLFLADFGRAFYDVNGLPTIQNPYLRVHGAVEPSLPPVRTVLSQAMNKDAEIRAGISQASA